jgi:hypothetical protein
VTSTAHIIQVVDDALAARTELVARGLPPLDVLVITGCALGVMLSGGGR